MRDLRSTFGARIRELRKEAKLSQEELAGRAHIATSYLSDLERGQQSPTLDVLNRIVRALNVTLAEFFSPFNQAYRVRFRKQRYDTR